MAKTDHTCTEDKDFVCVCVKRKIDGWSQLTITTDINLGYSGISVGSNIKYVVLHLFGHLLPATRCYYFHDCLFVSLFPNRITQILLILNS